MKWSLSRTAIVGLSILAAVCAGIGQPLIAVVSILTGLLVFFWQLVLGDRAEQAQEAINDAQAEMQLRIGAGNAYSQAAISGKVRNPAEQIAKALELDPLDLTAMLAVSNWNALALSSRKASGAPVRREDIVRTRRFCRSGRKAHPDNSGFPRALGVLADVDGNHEVARLWFLKAKELSPPGDPYWRLHMATSYALSEQFDESLQQIKLAIDEGASVWIVNFYMGRALS
jgi:type II secretory pathway pseudopilin PulG